MRYLILLGLVILLVNCAKTNDYYTKSAQTFEGKSAQFLLEQWGPPDSKTTENGNTVYLYKTEQYRAPDAVFSPAVGINPKGGPLLVSAPHLESGISLICFTAFIVNKQGVIIDTRVQGNGC